MDNQRVLNVLCKLNHNRISFGQGMVEYWRILRTVKFITETAFVDLLCFEHIQVKILKNNKKMIFIVFIKNGTDQNLNNLKIFLDDAGTYSCTATNSLGSSTTSAILAVPGNRRSLYGV